MPVPLRPGPTPSPGCLFDTDPELDSKTGRLQGLLRVDGGPMTLLKGFAAGTPGFSIWMVHYGSIAVVKALGLLPEPYERAQAVALLDVVRQVRFLCVVLNLCCSFVETCRLYVAISRCYGTALSTDACRACLRP